MRKTFLFLLVLLLTPLLWAATPVSNPAVMNFGESNYLSDASGHASINLGTQGGLNYSGSGPLSSPTGATGARINFTGMDTSKKYMWLKPKNASATITSTNSCGATLSVTRLSAYSNSTSTKPASITIGTSSTFAYYDHAGFSASVSLSGTPTKTCFFDGVLTGEIQYGEGKNTGQVTYSSMDLEIIFVVRMPVTLQHDADASLNFGTICRSNNSQTLIIPAVGTPQGSHVCPFTADVSADSFTVTASDSDTFSVTLPSSADISNGTYNLTVSNFTASCTTGCTPVGGTKTFTVGGTLTIPANAPAGDYTGPYSVSITY